MSSRRFSGANGDHEYLRAACVERKEAERMYDVLVSVMLGVNCRVGFLTIQLEAYRKDFELGDPPVCRYSTEWPNASVMGFTATLFNAQIKLTQLLRDSVLGLSDPQAPTSKG